MPYAKMMKETVGVPILCAGRMDNPDMASGALDDGVCDIISLGRPLLADPDYVNKLRTGKTSLIRPCLSCQEGCMGRIQEYSALNCAVNPQAARERATRFIPALQKKYVLVVGGGVAGCEAARVLTLRGHEVTLCEKSDLLGGNLIPGGVPSFKEDDHALVRWYVATLAGMNVKVRLKTEVRAGDVKGYDAVILASGSRPKIFSLGDDAHTYTAADVLEGKKDPGKNTAVIGGGLVGCELALHLREKGVEVFIVEALDHILKLNRPLCHANAEMLERLIPYKGVKVRTGVTAKSFREGRLALSSGETLLVDSVILAVGYTENRPLYDALAEEANEYYVTGDALRVANIMYAIWNAFEIASGI
ncbi:MAG: FAD-dependent oxidoreductase [Treponema sp.]|jgi:2-enoate reductase|nr:FAD-dependent oxidoreductase [Treponema sp.]